VSPEANVPAVRGLAETTPHDPTRAAVPLVHPGAWPEDFASEEDDREALLVLSHLEGLTPRELHRLAGRERRAGECLRAVLAGAAGSDLDRRRARAIDLREVRSRLRRRGARLVVPGDREYPEALLALSDPPAWLFVRARAFPPSARSAVAVVGARNCSPYGREVAQSIGAGLAAGGVCVVSGAARGIDAAAHRGALSAHGPTVAVLGSGIDVPYPANHRGLLDRVADSGAVISEYPPGVRAHPRRFPARNRIVAALARAVVVVEGAPGSGSLITAGFAEDLPRDLLAVPGPVTSELSEAPHQLIRDGAGLVRDAGDVLAALGLAAPRTSRATAPRGEAPSSRRAAVPPIPHDLGDMERSVLDALAGAGNLVDQVASETGLTTQDALRALVSLELRRLVVATGGRYRRALRGEASQTEAGIGASTENP
jgi:DNA processing protein